MATIDVFTASAGSGKTYTLARRVIDLLISEPKDKHSPKGPKHYSHILAVTFTNPATAEMKSRIVDDLATIADRNDNSETRQKLIKAQIETRKEIAGTTLEEETVVSDCKKALDLILYDYEHLAVSTIDSFVQKIVRSFAYDKGLPSNYGIQIDENAIIDNAIDNLMSKLKPNEDSKLLKVLIEYANDLVKEGKRWNVEKEIKELGKDLLSKSDLDTSDIGVDNVLEINKNVHSERESACGEMHKELESIAKEEITSDIKANFMLFKTLNAILNGESIPRENLIDKVTKICNTNIESNFKKNCTEHVKTVEGVVGHLRGHLRKYFTCEAILSKIYSLGVLSELQKSIKDVQDEEHAVAISSTNDVLYNLLYNKDNTKEVPFIYEKAGIRYDNIMIDEFQDTSVIQYRNFMPLLENSLSEGHDCLVVGDVKQSIYRFREGDWHLLHNLSTGKQGDSNGCEFAGHTTPHTLDNNWRSLENIVKFNNLIYSSDGDESMPASLDSAVKSQLSSQDLDKGIETIADLYVNSHQKAQRKADEASTGKGYVSINIIDIPNGHSDESKEIKEAAQNFIKQSYVRKVKELVGQRGCDFKDICFLVSKKDDGEKIITELNKEGIPTVSIDSLFVANATSVKCVLDMLKYLTQGDESALFRAAIIINDNDINKIAADWATEKAKLSDKLQKLRGLGTIELINTLLDLISEETRKKELPFIEAFYEKVMSFVGKQSSNLSLFINFAEDDKKNWVIQAPASMNAVNVMTIHKSKGLQFKIVMIPYFDWKIENKPSLDDTIWCDATDDKIASLIGKAKIKRLPVAYSKMAESFFEKEWLKEKNLRFVDNLNKAYVATTRAEDMLFTWGTNTVYNNGTNELTILSFLKKSLEKHLTDNKVRIQKDNEGCVELDCHTWDLGTEADCIGAKQTSQSHGSKDRSDSTAYGNGKEANNDWDDYDTIVATVRPSKNLAIAEEEVTNDADRRHKMIAFGITMHEIFQRIKTDDDTPKALNWAYSNGIINAKQKEDLGKLILGKLESVKQYHWFDGSMDKVWSEITMVGNSSVRRADRVMKTHDGDYVVIDYKFGNQKKEEYNEQVKQYMKDLKAAGAKSVRGFVWYVEKDEVAEVC